MWSFNEAVQFFFFFFFELFYWTLNIGVGWRNVRISPVFVVPTLEYPTKFKERHLSLQNSGQFDYERNFSTFTIFGKKKNYSHFSTHSTHILRRITLKRDRCSAVMSRQFKLSTNLSSIRFFAATGLEKPHFSTIAANQNTRYTFADPIRHFTFVALFVCRCISNRFPASLVETHLPFIPGRFSPGFVRVHTRSWRRSLVVPGGKLLTRRFRKSVIADLDRLGFSPGSTRDGSGIFQPPRWKFRLGDDRLGW